MTSEQPCPFCKTMIDLNYVSSIKPSETAPFEVKAPITQLKPGKVYICSECVNLLALNHELKLSIVNEKECAPALLAFLNDIRQKIHAVKNINCH